MLTPASIWQEAQNRPTQVVRDLARYAPSDVVYEVLLRRGVFKWLAVRRQLIRLKNAWRDEITTLRLQIEKLPRGPRRRELSARLKALEDCRGEVRRLCHSPRWQAPDHDEKATRWLGRYL